MGNDGISGFRRECLNIGSFFGIHYMSLCPVNKTVTEMKGRKNGKEKSAADRK